MVAQGLPGESRGRPGGVHNLIKITLRNPWGAQGVESHENELKWHQNGTQMAPKFHPNATRMAPKYKEK